MDRLTEATIAYLSAQIDAGAEVVKLFDSWAGSLKGADFQAYAAAPARRIIAALKARHPGVPVIAFPREAGPAYAGFARATGADCVALDNSVDAAWAAKAVQVDGCVQGNLAPQYMVTGGQALIDETRRIREVEGNLKALIWRDHGARLVDDAPRYRAVPATVAEARLLMVENNEPLLQISRLSRDFEGNPRLWRVVWIRTDRLAYEPAG